MQDYKTGRQVVHQCVMCERFFRFQAFHGRGLFATSETWTSLADVCCACEGRVMGTWVLEKLEARVSVRSPGPELKFSSGLPEASQAMASPVLSEPCQADIEAGALAITQRFLGCSTLGQRRSMHRPTRRPASSKGSVPG